MRPLWPEAEAELPEETPPRLDSHKDVSLGGVELPAQMSELARKDSNHLTSFQSWLIHWCIIKCDNIGEPLLHN